MKFTLGTDLGSVSPPLILNLTICEGNAELTQDQCQGATSTFTVSVCMLCQCVCVCVHGMCLRVYAYEGATWTRGTCTAETNHLVQANRLVFPN